MEIRSDIPIPETAKKYPWHKMKIGDSVHIPFEQDGTDFAFRKAVGTAYAYQATARRLSEQAWQFKSKSYRADGYGIIWRVS